MSLTIGKSNQMIDWMHSSNNTMRDYMIRTKSRGWVRIFPLRNHTEFVMKHAMPSYKKFVEKYCISSQSK